MIRGKKNLQLVLRADADSKIGMGHLMRCLAIAQAARDRGGRVCFLTRCEIPSLLARLRTEGMEVQTIPSSIPLQEEPNLILKKEFQLGEATLLLDGYQFETNYQKALFGKGNPLVVMDDLATQPFYFTDAIINQNPNSHQLHYETFDHTEKWLGLSFAPLRHDVLSKNHAPKKIVERVKKVLVSLGGSDPHHTIPKILHSLERIDSTLEITVIAGSANPRFEELKNFSSKHRMEILAETREMGKWMQWADFAITGSGGTVWELAYYGLPAAVIALVDNQEDIARSMHSLGSVLSLGTLGKVDWESFSGQLQNLFQDPFRRNRMSQVGMKAIDGRGADRIAEKLLGLSNQIPAHSGRTVLPK